MCLLLNVCVILDLGVLICQNPEHRSVFLGHQRQECCFKMIVSSLLQTSILPRCCCSPRYLESLLSRCLSAGFIASPLGLPQGGLGSRMAWRSGVKGCAETGNRGYSWVWRCVSSQLLGIETGGEYWSSLDYLPLNKTKQNKIKAV